MRDHAVEKLPDYVSHPFRESETSNKELGHHGVDFSYFRKDGVGPIIEGVPIQAVMDGFVAALGFNRRPYGNMILIETPYALLPPEIIDFYALASHQSLYHLYSHMLEPPSHSIAAEVNCGDELGLVGNTGFSGNPHLHLELRRGPSGVVFPQMVFYDTVATQEQMDAYQRWRTSGEFLMFDPMSLFIFASS